MMVYRGRRIWPPHWIWISGPDKTESPEGEGGTLENVQLSRALKSSLFLTIRMLDGNRYMGCLNFDDDRFARKVLSILHEHLGQTIKNIAEIDIA